MKHTVLGERRKYTIAFAFSLLLLAFSSLAKANDPSGPTDCDLLAAHPGDSSKVVAGVEWEDMEMKKAVRACNKALKEYPGSVRLKYQYGRALHKGGFYENALKWYRKAADEGHVFAMYRLGIIYDDGEIVEKDVAQALKWNRKAADKGNADAMYNIGVIYSFDETGQFLENAHKDIAQALKWFRKAADKGNADAMYNLGVIYESGESGQKDIAQALKWYRKAADKGDAESKTIVARLESEVAEKEKAKAKKAAVQQQILAASNRAVEKDAVYVLKARLGDLCEVLENTSIVENIKRTAGKLNHPAYIVGVNYDCHSSYSGIQNLTIYVGFVINPNKSGYQCTSNGRSSSAILDSFAWAYCGGLN